MVYTVGRMSILHLVLLFAVYLGIHIFVAVTEKKLRTKIEEGNNSPETIKEHKVMKFFNNWFPGMFVILLLAIFYLT